ncbi:MAG TPA: T9SS type A sorting domain-containing protein, partial [Bacteroidia bacterium]|nr:T9SS type A sorting domain-containing protein [Bacteroidia bacterium]
NNDTASNDINLVGIEELNQLAGISVYPVPATDQVNFHFENAISDEIVITLTDVTGKVLSVQHLPDVKAGTLFNLDLTGYAAGTYFYSIRSGDKTGNGKLIKTK